jgi:hypothetical protein
MRFMPRSESTCADSCACPCGLANKQPHLPSHTASAGAVSVVSSWRSGHQPRSGGGPIQVPAGAGPPDPTPVHPRRWDLIRDHPSSRGRHPIAVIAPPGIPVLARTPLRERAGRGFSGAAPKPASPRPAATAAVAAAMRATFSPGRVYPAQFILKRPSEAALSTGPAPPPLLVTVGPARTTKPARSVGVRSRPTGPTGPTGWRSTRSPSRSPVRVGMRVRSWSPPIVVAGSPIPVGAPARVPEVAWTPFRERAWLTFGLRRDTQAGQSKTGGHYR